MIEITSYINFKNTSDFIIILSLLVQWDVGIQNGSCHCFGAGVITDCAQADRARFST